MSQNTTLVLVGIGALVIGLLLGLLFCNDGDVKSATNSLKEDAANAVVDMKSGGSDYSGSVENPDGIAFSISVDSLSQSQQDMLRSMGIEGSEIQVSNAMLACAEAKLGGDRISAIRNGAAPSFGEGVQLMACYKSN